MNFFDSHSHLLRDLMAVRRLFRFRVRISECDYSEAVRNWRGSLSATYVRAFFRPLSDGLREGDARLEAQTLVAQKYEECSLASDRNSSNCIAELAVGKFAADRATSSSAAADELAGWLFGCISALEGELTKIEGALAEQAIDPGWD